MVAELTPEPERVPARADLGQLAEHAHALRDVLARTMFDLDVPGDRDGLDAPSARLEVAALAQQLDDHVLPRLDNLDAPALVVVGGSTGSGKSLLVNSLVGADVTRPGVLRPTTTAPVLVHEADAAQWFGSRSILPGLARVHSGDAHGHSELRVVESETVPRGVALLDSPDIDSVSSENRALAAELLAAADLWIFVTTAARYADAVPWEFLQRARERGTPLVLVMNRTPPGHSATLRTHLDSMLSERGLGGTQVFTIEEQTLDGTRLASGAVAAVRAWVEELGNDDELRTAAIRRSLRGTLLDLATRTDRVAEAASRQTDTVAALRELAHVPYETATENVRSDIGQGALLKGEVLSRWEELLGTGELLRQLRTGVARLRDRVTGVITGRPKHDIEFNGAVEHVVETLIRTRGDEAASKAAAAWRSHGAGAALLRLHGGGLDSSTVALGPKAADSVRDWQGHVLELIRNVGGDKKSKARVLSFGVNGIAAVVMVLVFAHTGGLTGAEVAVAGGASAVGHTLLEALLGDQAIRTLALDARSDLEARVDRLYADEVARYDELLAPMTVDAEAAAQLRAFGTVVRSVLS